MIATDEPDKIKLGLKTEKHDSGLWEPLQSNKEILEVLGGSGIRKEYLNAHSKNSYVRPE